MTFLEDFKLYWEQDPPNALIFWVYPAVAVVLIYVITLLIAKISTPRPIFTHTMHICAALAWGGALTALFTAGLSLYFWNSSFFSQHPIQASVLLSFFIAEVAIIAAIKSLAKQQSQSKIKNLVNQPPTHFAQSHFVYVLRNSFERLKVIGWLLPLLSLVTLLPIFKKDQHKLLCVVLDNSSSMGGATPSGIVPLQVGKDALIRTLSSIDNHTDFLLGYFDNRNARPTVQGLVSSKSTNGLQGTVLFYNSDKSEAIEQIQDIPVGLNGSPICETIWKIYLTASESHQQQNYSERILVIITDGLENGISGSLEGFFCDQPEFDEFFPSDWVKVVKLEEVVYPNFPNESSATFMSKIRNCGYTELDGTTLNSYNDSINQAIANIKKDSSFPVWLLLLYLICVSIILLLSPKQNI